MLCEKNVRTVVCVMFALAATLTALAGSASADLFTYDFEGLSNGDLVGQDNWAQAFTWVSPTVGDGTAGSGDTSKVIYGRPNSEGGAGGEYSLTPGRPYMYFTSANATAAQEFQTYAASGDSGIVAGAVFDTAHPQRNVFGFQVDARDGNLADYIRVADGSEIYGGTVAQKDHLYVVRLEMDFSVAGGRATFYRKDITAGQTGFYQDPVLTNVALGLTTDGQGRYAAGDIVFRVDASPNSYADNFYMATWSPIPEPGSIILLASGLIGLLAYAWRKRK